MKNRKNSYKENIFVKIIRILLIIVLLPIVLIYLIVKKIKDKKEQKLNQEKIAVFNMSQLDLLSGKEFELFLKTMFEKLGYCATLTKGSHDYGVDLIIEKSGIKSIVQAKCYGKTVGVKAVQEIVTARNFYKIENAIVATNNYFSKEALLLASENNVELLDRDVIENVVKKFNLFIDKEKNDICAITKKAVYEIESKYPHWI